MAYGIRHGTTELIQFLSVHSPIKGSTYVRTGQTKFDVVLFVGHRILAICEHGTFGPGREKTYLDHGEQDGDGAENGLGWGDARDLLRKIHGIYGYI